MCVGQYDHSRTSSRAPQEAQASDTQEGQYMVSNVHELAGAVNVGLLNKIYFKPRERYCKRKAKDRDTVLALFLSTKATCW